MTYKEIYDLKKKLSQQAINISPTERQIFKTTMKYIENCRVISPYLESSLKQIKEKYDL